MHLSENEMNLEKKYLDKTIAVIRKEISSLGQQLYDKEEKVEEFKKLIWDSKHDMDPAEMREMMATSDLQVQLMTKRGAYLQKLFRIQNKPYFGAITFKEDEKQEEKLYIGITHVDEENHHLVYDWRAPICSMFYDFEVGTAYFKAPEGVIEGEITNKRQFNIEDGKLIHVFDNNINIDDELLQEVLATSSNDKMKNIVNTIQQEQNAIIRNIEDKTLIVQGIAGSGKTSVALHRIAFLLYKIENLNSKNVLIFSPNQVFTEYISNVLPELGEENTMQTTFSDFLSSFLMEYKEIETFTAFIERYYKYTEPNKELVKYKQSDEIIEHIESYIKNYVNSIEFIDDLENHDYFYTKEELNEMFKNRYEKLLLIDRIDTMASKICDYSFEGKQNKKSQIKSKLLKLLNKKINFIEIYKSFFESDNFLNNYKDCLLESDIKCLNNKKIIKYEDACLLVYIKGLLEGFDYRGLIKEVVIDEAQDYNLLQYKIIQKIFQRSSFTILGDINQTINPYYKYDSLEILTKLFASSKYLELRKTYRSSEEIVEHTNKILGLNHVSAIRNSTNHPVIIKKEENIRKQLLEDISTLKEKGSSLAIITKTDDEAIKLYNLVKEDIKISILDSKSKDFKRDLVIVPSYVSKGLEFDNVIVYTELDNKYTTDEKYLYYVACTRCQHQLIIYNN